MAKGDTTKTVLIVGGSIAGLYILAKSGAFQKAQEALGGSLPSIGINLGDLGLGSQLPLDLGSLIDKLKLPQINLPEINLPDLLPDTGPSVINPPEHATVPDVIYSMPSWAKGVIGVSAGLVGGYGGFKLIQVTLPLLKQLGIQAARGVGGAGSAIARALSGRAVAAKTATSIVPKVGATAASRGILGGFLPAIAFTGIIEGAYQIFRMIRGEQNIGYTGTGILDIINLITGRSPFLEETRLAFFGSKTELLEYARTYKSIPTLLFPTTGRTAAAAPAAVGVPIQTAPTWAMMEYGAAEQARWGGPAITAADYAKAIGVTPKAAAPAVTQVVAALPTEQKAAWLAWESARWTQ